MKKFILLISAWLSLHASAQIETTRYGFTYTANNPDAGEYTTLPLPAEFRMIGYQSFVFYQDSEGFILTDENKMVYTTYTSEPYNDVIRVGVSYEATYTENGEKKTVTRDNWEEWMQAQSYDLTTWGASEEGIKWILEKDPAATIKITRIQLDNFDKLDKPALEGGVSIPVDYKFTSATVNNEEITEITATGHNATLYNGSFTVKNEGAQPCNIARFDIPEQYRGGYVRIDFSKEPEPNWGLNLAFEKAPGEGVEGGWKDINSYDKRIGTSRYYKIPEEAITMNPQIWKNANDNESWTIDIDGFYLTTGFDYSQVYTDEYFPLSTEKGFNIELWNPEDEKNDDVKYNAFDNATKQLTLGNCNAAGWTFNNGEDFSNYKYAVVVLNQLQTYGLQFRLFDENNYFSKCTEDAFNDNFYLTLELNKLFKRDADKPDGIGDKLDPSHIYIAAFWSYTGTSSISNVFLTNVEPNWAKPEARTTKAGNYGTVCLPYPAVCTNGYVYTIAGKDAEGSTLYLEPYNGVMRPGTPYIYKSIGEGVKFYQIESEDAKADEALTYNGLVGCFNTTTQGDTYYALGSDNQWVKMDANVTFKNRAYLDLSSVPTLEEEEPSVANVAMRVIPGTTGIETVQQDETTDDQAIYTLSGIRVDDGAKLGRGIYIRGGKKFIVK
ncbi:hypothetical protein [Paraprevotella clara]|uniref:hypothetical protein n=1 Tax=Paraprevotella clara TaxID=454154 RepID=UPI002674BA93|nr:hypothetical protein [Paraprevotella clara]